MLRVATWLSGLIGVSLLVTALVTYLWREHNCVVFSLSRPGPVDDCNTGMDMLLGLVFVFALIIGLTAFCLTAGLILVGRVLHPHKQRGLEL